MEILKGVLKKGLELYGLTDFEKRVLLNTLEIRRGSTISYKQLAAMSGRPRAYRAVGNIMNKNPLPFLIPCHRVVASRGKLGGYAYGVATKRVLLAVEGAKI